jgi:hypothetical protein
MVSIALEYSSGEETGEGSIAKVDLVDPGDADFG